MQKPGKAALPKIFPIKFYLKLNNRYSDGTIIVSDKIVVDYSKGVVVVSKLIQRKLLLVKNSLYIKHR